MTNLFNRLNGNDRLVIQTELNDGASFHSIATILGKHPATISREVRKYSSVLDTYGYGGSHNRCIPLCDCEKHDCVLQWLRFVNENHAQDVVV